MTEEEMMFYTAQRVSSPPFVYNFEARRSPARLLAEIGLTEAEVEATAAGRRLPAKVRDKPRDKPRLPCPVCRKPINAVNCAPVKVGLLYFARACAGRAVERLGSRCLYNCESSH